MFRMPKAIPTASKAPIRKGEHRGIGLEKVNASVQALVRCLSPSRDQHFPDEIDPHDPDVRMPPGGLDGQIRRAGGHIQKTKRVEESHPADGEAPPGNVPAEAQKMVQKVIPARDRG